jgi:hypothetical protein
VLLAGDEPLTCTEHAKTKHSSLARESIASRPVRAEGESAVNPPVGKIQVPNDLRTALKGALLATSQWKAITPKAPRRREAETRTARFAKTSTLYQG